MMLENQRAVVTGGSRGLGLGIVEALVERGATVTVVARTAADLESISRRHNVQTIEANITDKSSAQRILSDLKPEILILNAGAPPKMAPIDEHSWESFSNTWETDVKAGLYWIQAALTIPLHPGSRVLVGSSGAAINGSPLSGGYAGAKRMLWMMSNYAERLSVEKGLGIRFQTIVPRQMVGGTGVGDVGLTAYAAALGISVKEQLARFGTPLPPREYGEYITTLLTQPQYEVDRAFAIAGDSGITVLEEAEA